MMTTATIEREILHKMIDELPQEREGVLRNVYEMLSVAERQVERGMLLDGREVLDRLRQKYV